MTGIVNIEAGQSVVAIEWPSVAAIAPTFVTLTLLTPQNPSDVIEIVGVQGELTSTGGVIQLTAPPSVSGYAIQWTI